VGAGSVWWGVGRGCGSSVGRVRMWEWFIGFWTSCKQQGLVL